MVNIKFLLLEMMMRLIKAADVTHMTQRLHYSSSAD